MEAVRFKAHVEKNRIIKVPNTVTLQDTDVDVIVLVKGKTVKKGSLRWERWIKEKVLYVKVITKTKVDSENNVPNY